MVLIDCRNRNMRLLGLCCGSLPVAEKDTFRKSSRGGKDVFDHHFDFTVPHKGQLEQKLKGGNKAEAENVVYRCSLWLPQLAFYTPQSRLPSGSISPRELGPPTSMSIKKISHMLTNRPNGGIVSVELSSCWMTLACVKSTK